MKYMLDTNICIYLIKNHPPILIEKFKKLSLGSVGISSITLAELSHGVEKSLHKEKNKHALEKFILPLEIFTFDKNAAYCYGHIRALLESSGKIIGSNDLLIASHALSLKATLITNNLREFERVPKLHVINWLK